MSEDWSETTLGEAAHVRIGRTPPRNQSRYWTSDPSRPFCTIASMPRDSWSVVPQAEGVTEAAETDGKAKRVPAGSLLMSFKLSIGRIGIAEVDLFPNEAIAWLEPKDKSLSKYFLGLALENADLIQYAGRAVKGSTLNKDSLALIPIEKPPRPVQDRIVALIGSMDNQINALKGERDGLLDVHTAVIGSAMSDPANSVQELGSFLALEVDTVRVEDISAYRIVGVLGYGLGLVDKGEILGAETSYARLNRLSTDRLVMRKLTAWEGPITVVEPAFDDTLASTEFPTFRVDRDLVSPAFLRHVCRWPGLWHEMKQRVTGSVQRRKRLNPEQLLAVGLRFPDLPVQIEVAAALDAVLHDIDAMRDEIEALRSVRATTLSALLNRDFEIPESFDELLTEGATV